MTQTAAGAVTSRARLTHEQRNGTKNLSSIRVAAIADLHGHLIPMPECDLLLLGGDIAPLGMRAEEQLRWAHENLRPWLLAQPAGEIVAIAGNHDLWCDKFPGDAEADFPWTYLSDSGCVFHGIRIWGSPYTKKFGPFPFMREDAKLVEIWEKIPTDTQILLVHGPVYGFGDVVSYPRGRDPHQGSQTLRNRLVYGGFHDLKLVISGHIHEGFGHYPHLGINYVSCAHVDERMRQKNPVVTFDFPVAA